MPSNQPCPPGCTCGRHKLCPPGCTCGRHSQPPKRHCEPGCTCGKHVGHATAVPCGPGCTCGRHDAKGGRTCPPGCTCARHDPHEPGCACGRCNRVPMPAEERRRRAAERKRAQRQADPEKYLAMDRERQERRKADPAYRESERQRSRRRREDPQVQEFHREYNVTWRQANLGKLAGYSKAWRQANPERAKEVKQGYRQRNLPRIRIEDADAKMWGVHRIRPEERLAMIAAQGGLCCYCGEELERPTGAGRSLIMTTPIAGPNTPVRFAAAALPAAPATRSSAWLVKTGTGWNASQPAAGSSRPRRASVSSRAQSRRSCRPAPRAWRPPAEHRAEARP